MADDAGKDEPEPGHTFEDLRRARGAGERIDRRKQADRKEGGVTDAGIDRTFLRLSWLRCETNREAGRDRLLCRGAGDLGVRPLRREIRDRDGGRGTFELRC